jgi:hypothetical protein
MNYFQWFIKQGWKNYIIPFFILLVIDYGIYMDWHFIIDTTAVILILESITIVGAHVGMIYHSIWTWKKSK